MNENKSLQEAVMSEGEVPSEPSSHRKDGSDRASPSEKKDPFVRKIAVALMILGATLRVARWVDNRSLWLDEVFLANNLIERSVGGLLRPLDYRQGAPVLFLVLSKGAIPIFGTSERALRLIPLIAGITALPLMWAVARRVLSGWARARID